MRVTLSTKMTNTDSPAHASSEHQSYRLLSAELAQGMLVIGTNQRILEANDAYLARSGYGREELVGKPLHLVEATETAEETKAHIERLRERKWDVFRTTHRRHDGSIWQVEISAILDAGTDGPIYAFARDVTSTNHIARLLEMSLNLARRAFSATLDDLLQETLDAAEALTSSSIAFFHFVDPDQKHLALQAWSTGTLRHMCTAEAKGGHYPIADAGVWVECFYQRKPVIHQDYAALEGKRGMPPGHARVVRELIVPVVRGDTVTAIIGVGNKLFPYTDEDIETVESLAYLITDVVERKRIEQSLRASEERYRAVIDALDGAVYVSSAEDKLEFMNRRLVEQIGRHAVGEYCFAALHGRSTRCPNCAKQRILAGEEVVTETHDAASGRWHRVVNTPLHHGGGQLSLQSIARDITESRQTEERRLELERRLQLLGRLEGLGRLAGGIAHDFNNILTSIIGHTELACGAERVDEQQREDHEQVLTAARRAAALCTQMLAYSGRSQFSMQSCRLDQLLQGVCASATATLPPGVTLDARFRTSACVIEADATQFSQMLVSLIANAVEAIVPNSGHIVVELSEARADQLALAGTLFEGELQADAYCVIEIRDDGCGMEPEVLARIYDPFFTTKFVGRGLGVAAALGIARAHRGAILFESQPKEGTRARVLIPTSVAAREVSLKTGSLPPSAFQRSTPVILLVDDDKAVRTIAQRVLQQVGYGVLLACDGVDGLSIYQQHAIPVDLVILDVTMPRLDGIETLRALRATGSPVPVIMTSGYATSDFSVRLSALGDVRFLQKPFSPSELLAMVNAALGR
jgi:two-component system, cell cycle sensor histidine kinase and response regulator CckA